MSTNLRNLNSSNKGSQVVLALTPQMIQTIFFWSRINSSKLIEHAIKWAVGALGKRRFLWNRVQTWIFSYGQALHTIPVFQVGWNWNIQSTGHAKVPPLMRANAISYARGFWIWNMPEKRRHSGTPWSLEFNTKSPDPMSLDRISGWSFTTFKFLDLFSAVKCHLSVVWGIMS